MSGQQLLQQSITEAKREGYMDLGDGRWQTPDGEILPEGVDPKPVQAAAIEFLFETGATQGGAESVDGGFDVWSVKGVSKTLVREGDELVANLERVYDQWSRTVGEDVAEEAARQLEAAGYDLEAE